MDDTVRNRSTMNFPKLLGIGSMSAFLANLNIQTKFLERLNEPLIRLSLRRFRLHRPFPFLFNLLQSLVIEFPHLAHSCTVEEVEDGDVALVFGCVLDLYGRQLR